MLVIGSLFLHPVCVNKTKIGERSMEVIGIAGAGISGLTAAIHLAKNGFPVRVYEKGEDVASRFRSEFQGLENWSRDEDVLAFLERIGIAPRFYHKPFNEVDAVNDLGRKCTIRSLSRPGLYIVKRGRESDSLDQYLKSRALELGVEIEFGQPTMSQDIRIIARGPQAARSVAYGMEAEVDHPDRIAVLLDDRIAPKAYAYLIIVDGKMTLASALMEEFHRAKECFASTVKRTQAMYGVSPRNAHPVAGYMDFALRNSYMDGGRMLVGESAGLQDFFLGFGMRYAIVSGYLAAESIVQGLDYDQLIKGEMEKQLKSSLVNRYIFEKLGNRGYRRLIRAWERSDDVVLLMRRWYGWRLYKGLLFPLAGRWLRRKRRVGWQRQRERVTAA